MNLNGSYEMNTNNDDCNEENFDFGNKENINDDFISQMAQNNMMNFEKREFSKPQPITPNLSQINPGQQQLGMMGMMPAMTENAKALENCFKMVSFFQGH